MVQAVIRFVHVLEVDIDRTRPVFRRLGRFEFRIPPCVEFEFLDGAIEVLQFDSPIFFVDGDHLEQVAVQTTVPATNFRNFYPMTSVPICDWANVNLLPGPFLYSVFCAA